MEQNTRMDFDYSLIVKGYEFELHIFEHVFQRVQLRLPATLSILPPSKLSYVIRNSVKTALKAVPRNKLVTNWYKSFIVDDQTRSIVYAMSLKDNQVRVQTLICTWKHVLYIKPTDTAIRITRDGDVTKAELLSDLAGSRFCLENEK